MRRRLAVVLATVALMMVTMVPVAFADNLGPCNDGGDGTGVSTGRNYAKHHISFLAKTGGIGQPGVVHNPGVGHQGFSVCL
jgi:hypothetical protein